MTPKLKKIIIIILVLAIAFVVYVVFIKKDPQLEPLVSGKNGTLGLSVNANTKVIANEISQSLTKIESLNLDRIIFTNPIFGSLQDRGEPILPEPIGRRNPFAPLGDTSVNFNSSVESIDNTQATTTEEKNKDIPSEKPVTKNPLTQ